MRQGGDKVELPDDREDGPFILFLNPHRNLDFATRDKLKSAEIRFACFSEMRDVSDMLSKSANRRQFIVTVCEELAELGQIIDSMDRRKALIYVIVLGRQCDDDETLDDLLKGGTHD